MDERILEKILLKGESLKQWSKSFTHKRYLYERVKNAGKDYFVGIRGIRGIGKTVLMLQLASETQNSAYFSADWAYAMPHSIYDICDALRKKGMTNIFIDEIHTKPGWAQELKTIYDEHELRVFFSGSSGLDIGKEGADLSRRALLYELKPVSFREYLNIRKGFSIRAYSLNELLKDAKKVSLENLRAYEMFNEYIRIGGVLYSGEGFSEALGNSVEKIITRDMAALRDINAKYEYDAYRILYHIAASSPFEAGFSSLSQKLGISKTFAIRLVEDLSSAGLLRTFYPCRGKNREVKKEPKIFLSIPFRHFFAESPDKGALREEFFVNHAQVSCYLKGRRGEKTSDFMVNGLKIEVGGPGKDFRQNPDYIAADRALAEGNKIPLFLFGFLY